MLENIANIIAGSDGEVWIVAPSSEQSGVAHCDNSDDSSTEKFPVIWPLPPVIASLI